MAATDEMEALFARFRRADSRSNHKGNLQRQGASMRPSKRHRGVFYEKVVVIDEDDDSYCSQDEDCKITGCWFAPPRRQSKRIGVRTPVGWKSVATDDAGQEDLSDCEVENGSHTDIRKQWEEAAKKKRKSQTYATTKGSSAGRAGDGVTISPREQKQSSSESVSTSKCRFNEADDGHVESKWKEQEVPNLFQSRNSSGWNLFQDVFGEIAKDSGLFHASSSVGPSSSNCNLFKEGRQSKEEVVEEKKSVVNGFDGAAKVCDRDERLKNQKGAESCVLPTDGDANKHGASEFIANREKVKQSDEFRKADEEEWQRRKEELQKQAQEAQKLKKRKKAEAERQLAMQTRQRQRVEQVRENHIKELKNNGIKELMRGQIQSELERKVAGCIDMATLLHRLGIAVEGGVQCTPEQVSVAYKKAILRFHPDRAAATANNDPRRQVEAEETFKLITKMKTTLQLVPPPPVKTRSARKY